MASLSSLLTPPNIICSNLRCFLCISYRRDLQGISQQLPRLEALPQLTATRCSSPSTGAEARLKLCLGVRETCPGNERLVRHTQHLVSNYWATHMHCCSFPSHGYGQILGIATCMCMMLNNTPSHGYGQILGVATCMCMIQNNIPMLFPTIQSV